MMRTSLCCFGLERGPIDIKAKICVGELSLPVLEVIDRLDVFIDSAEDETQFNVVFADYVLWDFIEKAKDKRDPRLPFIQPLLRSEIIGQGEPLEYLLKVILCSSLSLHTDQSLSWGEFLPKVFGCSEFLKDESFQICNEVCYLPVIKKDATETDVGALKNNLKSYGIHKFHGTAGRTYLTS